MGTLYIVYCHTNTINGKKYIGLTSQTPNERWRKGTRGYNDNFIKDVRKYGWDNFNHDILMENLTKSEAETAERMFISKYDTTNELKGYNIDLGGIYGNVFSKCHKKRISNGRKGMTFSESHRKNLSIAHIGNKSAIRKQVKCVETENIYESVNEAERVTKVNAKNISAVCLGKRRIAGGYHWQYV